jgi:hypothetical protein
MLLGDVRGEAVRRDLLAAEPAEGLAGRDVDALHCITSMGDCRLDVKRESAWRQQVLTWREEMAMLRQARRAG